MNPENKEIINKIDQKFRYTKTNCCCCTKLIDVYMVYDYKFLTVYTDQNRTRILVKIPKENIVCINKRQIDKNDVYKFSIHYFAANMKLKEIKLKTETRTDTNIWIRKLRELIEPKRFELKPSPGFQKGELSLYIRDSRKFYLALCHLEYILSKPHFQNFFNYYKNKINPNYGINYDYNDDENLNQSTNHNIQFNNGSSENGETAYLKQKK